MNEHNRVIRKAQHFLRTLADQEPQEEYGYQNYGPSRLARSYREAALKLEAMIEPEEASE